MFLLLFQRHTVYIGTPVTGVGDTDNVVALLQVDIHADGLTFLPVACWHLQRFQELTVHIEIHLALLARETGNCHLT